MRRCYVIARSLAERLDQPLLSWLRALARANCALLAGDTSEATSRAVEARDIGTWSGVSHADLEFGDQPHGVNTQRGRFSDGIIADLQQARVQMPGLRERITGRLASEHARGGRLELAHELLDERADQHLTGAAELAELPAPPTWAARSTPRSGRAV